MNLIKFVRSVLDNNGYDNNTVYEYNNRILISYIRDVISDRITWLEDREPESYGMIHDVWDDKYDSLNCIYDMCEDIINGYEHYDDMSYDIIEMFNEINYYQITHGGLSRLKILI